MSSRKEKTDRSALHCSFFGGTIFLLIIRLYLHEALFVTIAALLYFNSSIGTTIDLHYCMGEFVSFSLFGKQSDKCGKCGMENHSENFNCCKNVRLNVDSSDQHLPGQIAHLLPVNLSLDQPCNYSSTEPPIPLINLIKREIADPPPFPERSVYLRNCSFLI